MNLTAGKPPKKIIRALEKVFAAEIGDRLPYQSKARIYVELLDMGLVQRDARIFGAGSVTAVRCEGYALTHAGRFLYCSHCGELDEK